jgi:spore germination protein KB
MPRKGGGKVKQQERISAFQFFILVYLFVIGSSVLYIPTALVASAKEDAWIVAIIGGILGVGISLFYMKLANHLQGKNMVQMYDSVFGVFIGKTLTLLFFYFCLILASMILRGIGDFMVTQVMSDTPVEVIMGGFVLIIVWAQKYGIEVFARTAEIFFPWTIFLFFLGVFLLLPEVKFERLLPLLDNGVKPLMSATVSYLGFPYFECVLLLMVVPYLRQSQFGKKSWALGTMAGALILFIPVILSIMVLGPELTANQSYVTYILAKKMTIPRVIERMEVIIAIFWIFTIFYKLLICFFCLTKSLGSFLKIENDNILTYPLGMLVIATAIIIGDNVVILNNFSNRIWPIFAFQMGIVLPAIIFITHTVKKIRKSQ